MSTILSFEEMFGKFDDSAAQHVPEAWSGDGIIRTTGQCQMWAESLQCDIVEATDRQLFIDIDTEVQFQLFNYQLKILKKHFWFKSVKITPSKQGLPHRHVIIEMAAPYPLMTRIALQACLGSDPTRELLSIRRCMDQEDNVVIFFEKKGQ